MVAVRYHVNADGSTMLLPSVFVPLLAAASLIAARSDDLFAQIFNRTMAKRETIHSIRATFTETTTSSLLEKPIVSHGTVIAAPPMRVLMTYSDPEHRAIVIDRTSLVIVWPDRREREKIDIAETQKRIDHYFTHANLNQLRSMFEIAAEPDVGIRRADRIDMHPKRKQIKEGLERLELWVDRETLLLVQIRMTFPGGDNKTIKLDDIAVNVPIAGDAFRIRP
jgi:outer membrane lipoprotein-sorting protein